MIVLTASGLVAITALPGQPDAPWVMVRANRAMDISSLLPGAPVTDSGAEDGWQFACVAPRAMVAEGLARCVECAAYPLLSAAVPVQDRQLAELAQGIAAIAAEMPWEPPAEDPPADQRMAAPEPPAPSVGSQRQQQQQPQTFDDPPAGQSQPITYDGPSPVTTTEDPFDALIPAQPTLCQLKDQP